MRGLRLQQRLISRLVAGSAPALIRTAAKWLAHCLLLIALAMTMVRQAGARQEAPQQNTKPDISTTPAKPAPSASAGKDEAKPDAPVKPLTPEQARQAQYVADSQKLYQLAQELKVEVDKSNKNTLSIAVTRKADEIEKLAKNLKERMRKEQ